MTPNPLPAPPSQQPTKKQSNVAVYIIIGVVVLFGCCGVGGILSAIAIPNFIKYQARAKQSECKLNLKQLYLAQQAQRAEKGEYTESFEDLSFQPERSRYAYVMGRSVLKPSLPQAVKEGLLEQTPADIRQALGAEGKRFTAACVGNIDNDPDIDVWTISSEDRVIDGERVPAGVPHNDVSDL